MEFFYHHALLPDDDDLLKQIDLAAGRLSRKLQRLNLSELHISEYNQRYLGGYVNNIRGTLQIASYLLAWSLAYQKIPLDKLVLVDYGGGCGIISLLAKELGVGTVIYIDIYDVSCNDARLIGQAIRRDSEAYVCGDIDELLDYFLQRNISAHVIVSYDVIEHIYNIESYLRKLRLLPGDTLRIVFASSANNRNPIIRRRHMKSHLAIEHRNREMVWGHKERDSLRSYLILRKDIIAQYASHLSSEEIDQLALATRGLTKKDIECQVLEYQKYGRISYKPDHPTNTCDPYTGNWAEHLMDIHWLEEILLGEGFSIEIKSGYYGFSPRLFIRLVKNSLNWLISVLQTKGLLVAPFYVICAQRGYCDKSK